MIAATRAAQIRVESRGPQEFRELAWNANVHSSMNTMDRTVAPGGAAAGLIVADVEQRVLAADRIFLEAIGCPFNDIEGRSVAEVLRVGSGPLDRLPIEPGASGEFRLSVTTGARRARLLRVSYAHVRLDSDARGGVFITVEDLTPH